MTKQVKVLGHKVKIREISLDNWEFGGLGQMQTTRSEMLINKDIAPDLKYTSLVHESIHFANDLLAIGLDEKQVTQLGLFFKSFLLENKPLVKEMLKG